MPNTLKRNSEHPDVTRLTQLLHQLELWNAPPQPRFDAAVERAVLAFQMTHVDERGLALRVDGVVGDLTWGALLRAASAGVPQPPTPHAQWIDPLLQQAAPLPDGGTQRGRHALETALGEMRAGAAEIGGDNRGPYVEKYLRNQQGLSWCAGFVSWCFDQHPLGIPFTYSLGARDVLAQFRRKGWQYDPQTSPPQPGDIIVWKRDVPNVPWAGHIGLVYDCSSDGILYTIEGNKGAPPAPVRRFSYTLFGIPPSKSMAKLLGFGRVPD